MKLVVPQTTDSPGNSFLRQAVLLVVALCLIGTWVDTVRWAYVLALEADGKVNQAIVQLRRCQVQSPNDRRYAAKLRELTMLER